MVAKPENILSKYLPTNALDMTLKLLRSEPVELKIKGPRKTKFGDYRFPKENGRHKISINSNLNPYAFLITLLHEFAHLIAFKNHGKQIKPHGEAWQKSFIEICLPFFETKVFPQDIEIALRHSLAKGNASSCTDLNLFRTLNAYDTKPTIYLEDIEEGAYFTLKNTPIYFKKGPKARKRYKCINIENKRAYMVHPLAEVQIIEPHKINKSA